LDITEVKQATEALRQERDFSAALLNTLGALVVVMDREGRIVRFNQACEINSGYRFAEVEGRYFFDIFLTPEEKAMVQEGFRRLSAGDFPLNLENHWLSRGGEKRLISWSNTTLTNSDGVVTYVIGTGIDITRQRRAEEALRQAHIELERRVSSRTKQLRQTVDKLINEIAERERAENRLRESEARFAAFMKYLPGSAIMRDRAGRFLFVNEAWEEKLGRQPGASLGKTVDDFWEPAIANRLKALDQEVFDRNKPIEAVVELPMAGEKHTFLSYRFPIRTESGQVEMVGAIGIDITDRLKAEEARDRLIEILEATPDFVGSADWDGRLFYLNRSAREMMGLSQQDDIAAMTYTETMPDWAVEHVLTQGRPIYAREGFWHGESAIRRRDGTEIPVSQVILAHRSQEGRVKFFSTICRDISDRKRAEEKLRKSEEKLRLLNIQLLTAQEDERRRLASELHDELGHALLTLKLHLSSVEQHLLPEQADLKKMMGHIVQYLTDTVEEVRRLYYALSPGDLEDLGLTTALRNMVEDFQELYAEIDWRIEMAEIDDLFPLHIQTLIYRIVQEALTNIGKHAYPNHVKIKVTKDDQQAVFVIDDDGRGFSMDDVLEGDKRGMGLAAMAQRVSLAGGDFDLWSRENQGVRIIFSIPFSPPGERV
jgi:PAS domain S-box-containing protein